MWLTQGLCPSYKTIANFRKNNPKALQTIFREFSMLLKNLKLITGDIVAVDGAFLRANASKNTLIMRKSVKKDIAKIDEEITNNPNMIVTADKGYYSSKELKKCIEDNIETIVPPRATAKTKKIQNARFSKNQFSYNHQEDCYICPNNQKLQKIEKQYKRDGRMLDVYRVSSRYCKVCPLKKNCLSDATPNKQMYRCEHEHLVDDYTKKMDTPKAKNIVKKRGSIVEHPFCKCGFPTVMEL
jgi:hypothetical protein